MKRYKKALLIAGFVMSFGTASAWSLDMGTTPTPAPQHDFAAMKLTLDHGGSASVEAVLSALLDGQNPAHLRDQMTSYDGYDVSDVLFHPAVVDALANTTPDRLQAWDQIADDLQHFFFGRATTG